MKRTGIMGGTFNPVHTAHLILAEAAHDCFGFDTVMFLPSGRPAYKRSEAGFSDLKNRIKLHCQPLQIGALLACHSTSFLSPPRNAGQGIKYFTCVINPADAGSPESIGALFCK